MSDEYSLKGNDFCVSVGVRFECVAITLTRLNRPGTALKEQWRPGKTAGKTGRQK